MERHVCFLRSNLACGSELHEFPVSDVHVASPPVAAAVVVRAHPVYHQHQSIGNSYTFGEAVENTENLRRIVEMSDFVAGRQRALGFFEEFNFVTDSTCPSAHEKVTAKIF